MGTLGVQGFTRMTPIPGYELRKLIHEGPRTVVYRGVRTSDQRAVVLKLLRDAAPAKRDVSRLQREAEILARIDHDNVIQVLDFLRPGQRAVLVLDDFGGISLREFVGEARSLDVATFLKFALALAKAITAVHAAGVIHRDIKPGNLLIDKHGVIKVLDMGLARFFKKHEEESLTIKHDEKVLGTADYLAPEQAVDSHAVDDEQTCSTIASEYATTGYLLDPHTAIGVKAARECRRSETVPMITLGTAHPVKFADAVEKAGLKTPELPHHLQDLFEREERFEVLPNELSAVQQFVIDNITA